MTFKKSKKGWVRRWVFQMRAVKCKYPEARQFGAGETASASVGGNFKLSWVVSWIRLWKWWAGVRPSDGVSQSWEQNPGRENCSFKSFGDCRILPWGQQWKVSCSCPSESEHSARSGCFMHLISREFLRNKGDASLGWDAKKPLCQHSFSWVRRDRSHTFKRVF